MSDDLASQPNDNDTDYVVVARRYRPQTFDDLVGQQQATQALKNAIETNRVGHAYLFTGARGVGKTSAARILSKALNCVQGPATEPCDECDVCLAVASGRRCRCVGNRRGQQSRYRRDPAAAVQRRHSAQPGSLQDLHHRRSPHADEGSLQRTTQDAGRATRSRQVHLLYDRSGKNPDHGLVSLPAIRFCAHRQRIDRAVD